MRDDSETYVIVNMDGRLIGEAGRVVFDRDDALKFWTSDDAEEEMDARDLGGCSVMTLNEWKLTYGP